MHILLTDVLTCPRCGPNFGLILLSDELNDRQVVRGHLGCPNCRQSYPIAAGVADLRQQSEHSVVPRSGSPAEDSERAYRLAALMGVTMANANLLIVDADGALPPQVGAILPQAHVIGCSADVAAESGGEGFVSRVLINGLLPFRNGSVRGAAYVGIFSHELAREAARVLMPLARLVVDCAGEEAGEVVRSLGFEVQLEQDKVVVAAAPGAG